MEHPAVLNRKLHPNRSSLPQEDELVTIEKVVTKIEANYLEGTGATTYELSVGQPFTYDGGGVLYHGQTDGREHQGE